MPNWCNNTLELSHEDPAMIERAKAAFLEGKLLNEFIPVPEDLHIVAGRVGDDSDPKQIKLVEQEELNRIKYGYSTWYDYCVNEWGTKWDVGGGDGSLQDIEGGVIITFDSAWSPPIAAYAQLQEQGFEILAMYYEPGMCFAGRWYNGDDDYYEYGGMTADEIEDTLPPELDEAFGISQSVSEWEQEQEEANEE